MTHSIPFPVRELPLRDVADDLVWRLVQLEAAPIRVVAADAARRAPIRIHSSSVVEPTSEAIFALKLEARVLAALRTELGEDRFAEERSELMNAIDDAIVHAGNRLADEAIRTRERELAEQEGVATADRDDDGEW